MSEDRNRNAQRTYRRRFLAGVGIAATDGALAAGSQSTEAQGLDGEGFRPPRHDKEAWMGSLAGDKDHRVFIDSASRVGAPLPCFTRTTFCLHIRKTELAQTMSTR